MSAPAKGKRRKPMTKRQKMLLVKNILRTSIALDYFWRR
jgi:hypothetical protein